MTHRILALAILGAAVVIAGCAGGLSEQDVSARVDATLTALAPSATPEPPVDQVTEPAQAPAGAGDIDVSMIPTRSPKYNHSGYSVTEEYDKFDDATKVMVVKTFYGYTDNSVALWYTYPGQTATIPEFVSLMFVYRGDDWRYLKCYSTTLLLDGNVRMPLEVEHEGDVVSGGVIEYVVAVLPTSQFLEILNSETIEYQLCNDGFEISGNALIALYDAASRMIPYQQ